MRQQPLGSMLVGMLNFVRWRYQAYNFPYMLAEAVTQAMSVRHGLACFQIDYYIYAERGTTWSLTGYELFIP